MDDKTKTQTKEVYGPSPILTVLPILKELEELLNDKEEYPWG